MTLRARITTETEKWRLSLGWGYSQRCICCGSGWCLHPGLWSPGFLSWRRRLGGHDLGRCTAADPLAQTLAVSSTPHPESERPSWRYPKNI